MRSPGEMSSFVISEVEDNPVCHRVRSLRMPPSDSDSDPGWNEALIAVCKKRGKTTTISEEDRIKQIQECLDEDADIDTMDGNGNTALHTAVKRGYQMVAKFLRKAGARTDIPNRNGQTAISLARDLGEQEIMCTLNEPSTSRNTDPSSHNTLLNPSLNSTIRKRTAAAQDSSFDGSLSKMRLISTSQADPQRDVVSDEQRSNRERTADDELVQPTKKLRKMTLTAKKETHKVSRGLKDCLHGTVYQLKHLMLIMHRARKLKYSFRLATEMHAAEKFDDVVLRYEDSNGDVRHRFLQVKHKQDGDEAISAANLLNITGEAFSLLKYFVSWRKVRRKPIFGGIESSKDFILCTNIGLKVDDLKKEGITAEEISGTDDLLILSNVRNERKQPQRYKFSIENSATTWKTLKTRSGGKVTDIEILCFLKEFILAVNQPNEIELGEIIESDIGAEFNRLDAGFVRDSFQIKVLNWFKTKEGTFLTQADEFFNEMRGKLDAIKTMAVGLDHMGKLKELGIQFNGVNTIIQNFINRLPDGSKQLLEIISPDQTLLTALQVYQTLGQRQKLYEKEIFTFVRLETLLRKEIFPLVLRAFEWSVDQNLLIVDCESLNAKKYSKKLWNPIRDIMAKDVDKKIIFITQAGKDLGPECYLDRETCPVDKTGYSFANLTNESQKELLRKRVTKFQVKNSSTNFAELLDIRDWDNLGEDDVKDLSSMDTKSLVELISKDELQIGRGLDGLENVEDYYVSRTIFRHVVIKEDILKDREIPDLLAISGIDGILSGEMIRMEETSDMNDTWHVSSFERCVSDELLRIGGPSFMAQGPTSHIILARNREKKQFTALRLKNKDRNVHWLRKEQGKYIWRKSHGNIGNLMQYKDDRERVDINERTGVTHLNESQLAAYDEPVIISDTAGMGKSTMLTHLASKMKENKPDMLVLKINLTHHSTALAKVKDESSYDLSCIDEAIQFLVKELLSDEFEFSRKVFEIMIKRKHKVALLFDGFDEISPTYEKTVIDLLQTLADYGIRKLLVATRPHTKRLLEAKLNAFSFEIRPFSTGDQERFFTSFWKTKFEHAHHDLNPTAKDRIRKYTVAIMKTLADSMKDQKNEFTAIPQQAKLVAVIFERHNERMRGNFDSCKDFIDSEADEPKFPEKINLTYLYEHFVEKKFEIFFTKRGGNLFDPRVLAEKEQSRKSYIAKHETLALYTLFDKYKIEELQFSQRNSSYGSPGSTDVKDYIERDGIITHLIDGQPRFGHRTYAEYFAAKFFSKILKKRKTNESFAKILVAHVLLEDKYETMRAFINWLLSGEYHDVLEGEFWPRFVKEHRSQKEETIFHLAAAEGNDHIIRMFLNCSGVNKDDLKVIIHFRDFTGKTAVHRAVEYGHLENIQLLVEDTGYEINCQDANGTTALHQAAYMGAFDVVRYFIDKEADVDVRTDVHSTLLYMAAREGELSLVDHLLEKVADVNLRMSYSTKLLYAATMGGQLEIVKYLFEKGANINSGIGVVWMPLNVAAFVGQVDIVNYLLEKGADVNSSTNNGETPLYTAALSGQLETVKYLLEKKANINSRTDDGSTPLHAAACRGRLSIVDYLLEKGADVNSSTNNGETPLYTAAECGKLEIVKYLVEKRANIDSRTNDGSTLLHAAAYGGELDIADYFLDKGANVDSPTNDGETPLYTAAESGKLEMVKYLLKKGANIDSQSNECWTALDGREDMVKYLLEMHGSYW